jgi:excisionase family DNA binding protein
MGSRQISSPDLLKPVEVAARLGVSRTWLYEAARAGRIPSIRIGGREGPLRFVPEDLQRWIDEARAEWLPGAPARFCVLDDGPHDGEALVERELEVTRVVGVPTT